MESSAQSAIWLALRRATERLGGAGVESPRLEAELLMTHVLGWRRARLLGHAHDPLDPEVLEEFERLTARRVAGEPLQYITGEWEFYGLPFRITPAVLIPRPETEILVERALSLADTANTPLRFADVGTGSGCIASVIARELPGARGLATDVSLDALALARENAVRLGVAERIAFVRCDLLGCCTERPLFDLILSNPPYVAACAAADLPGTVRDYEPPLALFGGKSGIETYRRLVPQAALRLAPFGHILLEVGAGQADPVAGIAEGCGLMVKEVIEDLQGIPRCVLLQRT